MGISFGNRGLKPYVGNKEVVSAWLGDSKIYSAEEPVTHDCLTFTANTSNSTVSMSVSGTLATIPSLKYSTNGGTTWSTFTIGSTTVTLANVGDSVQFRAAGTNGAFSDGTNYAYFVMTGSIAASGNIMSLIDSTVESRTITQAWCFCNLFRRCTTLTSAPELPATTLATGCYSNMFAECISLTSAPSLPATSLAGNCYANMFAVCMNLTTPPNLPATTLASGCYLFMFTFCTRMNRVPKIRAASFPSYACSYMFSGCSAIKVYAQSSSAHTYAWKLPSAGSGTAEAYAFLNMLSDTGGDFTSDPVVNTTYYVENEPV